MIFLPTYLCIKQHTVTSKLYFCKTTKKDPLKYLGSGLHWQRHLNLHGRENVVTLWYSLFTDQDECTKFALEFSEKMDIVNSNQWLNLKPENGLDGMPSGIKLSTEHKEKVRLANTCKRCTEETKVKISIANTGKKRTIEQRLTIAASHVTHGPETYLKIALANANKTRSIEQRLRISKAKLGSHHTEEARLKMRLAKLGKRKTNLGHV